MLAPHNAEDAKFGSRGLASAQQLLDFFEFFQREAVLPDHLRGNGSDRRGGHWGIFIVASQLIFRMWNRRKCVENIKKKLKTRPDKSDNVTSLRYACAHHGPATN